MPLESVMLCLDNSEWMRNGDYVPSRMECMQDAANMVSTSKIQSNPENTVGVMSMAGRGAEVMVSPTDDMGKLMACLHDLKLTGKLSFVTGVQVAWLALKHRINKNGGQRIVVFVGSPISEEPKALTKVGKLLKKNGIAVDVVSMGEHEENQAKLEEFINAANSSDNSHLVTIPPGCIPTDLLVSSPILNEGGDMGGASIAAAAGAAQSASGPGDYPGVDANMDPELAMALRVSMEEERARQEREAGDTAQAQASQAAAEDTNSGEMEVEQTEPAAAKEPTAAPSEAEDNSMPMNEDNFEFEEQALLQQALAMSMQDPEASAMDTDTPAPPPAGAGTAPLPLQTTENEDADMQLALEMSMQADDSAAAKTESTETAAAASMSGSGFHDTSFVNSMLASLPGVDPSDPLIQQAIQQIQAKQDQDEKKDEKEQK